jgi:hypothetical protein
VGVDRPHEEVDTPDSPDVQGQRSGGHDSRAEDHELSSRQAAYFTEYKATVDAEYRAYAIDQGCDRVEKIEKEIVTPAMRRIEAEDPDRQLVGLEYSLKGKDRLTEKVTKAMAEQPELKSDDAFALVKDAIRYTFQYPEESYTAGVKADITRLEAAGFERVDCRNTWTNEEYKGINSRWLVPDSGQRFEVQFHTQASFEAKQETHAAYEKLRSPATPKDEQDKLVAFQRDVTARVRIPSRAAEIPDYP